MSTTKTSLRYDDVAVGQELPPLPIPLTRTLIVSTAIASRDYQDVHHDPTLAVERGSPATIKKVAIRLGAPNYPGDTMTMTGSVTAKDAGVVEVAVRGSNSRGDHVTGTVTVALL